MAVQIPDGSLMESTLLGQAAQESLSDASILLDAASALCEAVSGLGHVSVRPVGRSAALIVGAASVLSHGTVRQAHASAAGSMTGKVLVVEAVAVGHALAEREVEQVRREGADWVGLWVWRGFRRLDVDRLQVEAAVVDGLLD